MKTVWVITGYNGLLNVYGCAGVCDSKELAEERARLEELDSYVITEHSVINGKDKSN